jgi:hypothetical protein
MHAVSITADFYNLLIFSMSETSLHIYTYRSLRPTVLVYHHLLNREHYGVAGLCGLRHSLNAAGHKRVYDF